MFVLDSQSNRNQWRVPGVLPSVCSMNTSGGSMLRGDEMGGCTGDPSGS